MASFLQVLGSGSLDSRLPASFLLFFEQTRYLFGAGEGTQRMATEAHVKLAKMRHVFVTRIQHDMVGGLTGQSHTHAQPRTPSLSLSPPSPCPDDSCISTLV